MKFAYIASEITPYASTGGLAEVAGALPEVIARAGHQVIRIMPCYRMVLEGPRTLSPTDIRISVPVGLRHYTADILFIEEGGVTTYFVRRDEFFDRAQLYNLPDRDYEDNFERFVFFQKVVVALLDRLAFQADIVHCNDWQTGLVPYFLEYGVQARRRGRREKVVYTLHNVAYQGIYPDSEFALTNLPFSAYSVDTFEYYGKISCLKAGITGADLVTTVSPGYAREILTPDGGFGLDGLLRSVQDHLVGLLNGIDTDIWDPARDPHLPANYDARNMGGKNLCRTHIAGRMNVKIGKDTLILAMVSRLVDMKGFDILAEAMDRIMEEDVVFVLLGSGQKTYEQMARDWATKWPGRVGVRIGYNAALAHEIQAGSDIMFLPSKSEPCGLTQFCSQRYGTLPVVHAVGGLADSVADPSEGGPASGIKFDDYSGDALFEATQRALALLRNPVRKQAVLRHMMNLDVSWGQAAKRYLALYEKLVNRG
ncbi:MAG TPA: glycogen/starch synthase [Kiritimatiellia bacterium]|nr:glycogen/starch synthase [Kiritimatiellia bacterium]